MKEILVTKIQLCVLIKIKKKMSFVYQKPKIICILICIIKIIYNIFSINGKG